SVWLSNKFPELRLISKLKKDEFKLVQGGKFKTQLNSPESGVVGFLRQIPTDIYKKVMVKKFKDQIDDLDVDYNFLTAFHDDLDIGCIVLVDRKNVTRSSTSEFVTIYGHRAKTLEFSIYKRYQGAIIIADRIEPAKVASNYSSEIFSFPEIMKLIDEIVITTDSVRTLIKAQIVGSPLITQSGVPSGTFATIYPSGGSSNYSGFEQKFLLNFFEDLYFPFTLDCNFGVDQKLISWYSRKKETLRMPKTDFIFFSGNSKAAETVLENRTKAKGMVDGVLVSSQPQIEGPLNTKTEIPLRLNELDINFGIFEEYLPEIRASIAYLKSQQIKDRVKEADRIGIFDNNILGYIKNETGEDLIVDYLTRKNMLLDPNIHFGRYENSGRFASALDKGLGVSQKRGLKTTSKVLAETLTGLIFDLTASKVSKKIIDEKIKRFTQDPAHIAELPLLSVVKDARNCFGRVLSEEVIISECAKKGNMEFGDA
ncbi:MAG: hypothetical protein ACC656_08695, partial [Candidatus Heimdallarchaeota archaeon]